MELANDQSENTTYLQQGDLAWNIIKRGDQYGIRLRDHKNPRIGQLDHIPSYPLQTSYVVEAVLAPFDSPKTMTVATPLAGYSEEYQCPGILNFRINGKVIDTQYPRYDSPYVQGNKKDKTFSFSMSGKSLFLDFENMIREF